MEQQYSYKMEEEIMEVSSNVCFLGWTRIVLDSVEMNVQKLEVFFCKAPMSLD